MNNISKVNLLRIKEFLKLSDEERKRITFPNIIHSQLPGLKAEFKVLLEAKQPQEWGSSRYDQEMSAEDLQNFLENEYLDNLNDPGQKLYYPIKLYQDLVETFSADPRIGIILNNIVKIGYRGKDANSYDGKINESVEFSVLDVKEYAIIQPNITIILAGGNAGEDYYGRASFLYLYDDELLPLTLENPINIYTDFLGNPVIHTYHPGYWFNLGKDGYNQIKEKIVKLIRDNYQQWKKEHGLN